jgi:creatinine amidohydrolase
MGHACELETSMILHLRPDLVRTDVIRDDPDSTPPELQSLFWARDFGRRTDHGAVGFPERASADRGRQMLEAAIRKVVTVAKRLLELPLESE